MRLISITILLFLAISTGCENNPEIITGYFESMHFVREGGGQIDFNLYTTNNNNELNAVVTEFDFRDTTIQVILEMNEDNMAVFSSLRNAMNNQIQINGDFQQSTLPTGTWAYIYLVNDNEETEVTNTGLRNSLLKFEKMVRDKIQ